MYNNETILDNVDSRSIRQKIEDLDGWFIKEVFLEAPPVKEKIIEDLNIFATPTIRDIIKKSPTRKQMKEVIKVWTEARYHSRSEEIIYEPQKVDFNKVEEVVLKHISDKGIAPETAHVLRIIMDEKKTLLEFYKNSLKFDTRAFYDWLDRNQIIIYNSEVR